MFGGVLQARQDGGRSRIFAGQYGGAGADGGSEQDLQGPPAAMEVCPSDQLRPSLTLSLDFDLWEG